MVQALEVPPSAVAAPADDAGGEPSPRACGNVGETGAGRRHQPLVPVHDEKVDWNRPQVQAERTDRLGCVDTQQHAPAAQLGCQAGERREQAVGVVDRAEQHQSRARAYGIENQILSQGIPQRRQRPVAHLPAVQETGGVQVVREFVLEA